MKLEMQVQALLTLLQSMEQEWCVLEQRRAMLEQEKPKLAAHLAEVLGLELQRIDRAELLEKLETAEQPVAATA